jgi:GH15 family glucan-1,4-alpha-glucosidase
MRGVGFTTVSEFSVEAGASVTFELAYYRSHDPLIEPIDPVAACNSAAAWWRDWCSRQRLDGRWRDVLQRSLITLKALTYSETGSMVAAPTTSLPECVGGVRNWDYRFCWLRDAAFTLYALLRSGYKEEARAWREWLLRAAAGRPQDLSIVFGLRGERRLTELELPWLKGYEGSAPVRTGNAACEQFQLDVYGELMDTLHLAQESGLARQDNAWALQRVLLDFLETAWHKPDKGIWEARSRAPLHLLEGDGLDCIRSRDPGGRALPLGWTGADLAAPSRRDPRGSLFARIRSQAQGIHAKLR